MTLRAEIDTNSQQLTEHAQRLTNEGKQPAELLATLLGIYSEEPPRVCRVCGCSDNDACLPPCWWVEDDLCSSPSCVGDAAVSAERARVAQVGA